MEVIGTDDDFSLVLRYALHRVAPLARNLDGRFDSLCAGVHRQYHVEACQIVKIFTKQGELGVSKCARGQGDFLRLLFEGLKNLWVTMTLIHRGVCGQAIQITFALNVVNPNTLSTFNHYVERTIVVRSVSAFKVNKF